MPTTDLTTWTDAELLEAATAAFVPILDAERHRVPWRLIVSKYERLMSLEEEVRRRGGDTRRFECQARDEAMRRLGIGKAVKS